VGRHRKQSESTVRRRSLIALSGLVPAGIVSATTAVGAVDGVGAEHVPDHNTGPLGRLLQLDDNNASAIGAGAPRDLLAIDALNSAPIHPAPGTPGFDDDKVVPVSGPLGVPAVAVAAYKQAANTLGAQQPGCGMSWELLAGIGRVESHHADNGAVDGRGTALTPIYGPALDGSMPGNEVIPDGGGGYQRAEGPMQFMPGTWSRYADANSNPQNIFDSALTAGRYLCSGGLDMRDIGQRTQAILRYNNSMAYVANVLAWSLGYATGVVPTSDALPPI
jgi:membrane-bound lytic murein transglycosylase B